MGTDDVKKKTSRDSARQRRGQQNDEYSELALQLPLPGNVVEKMDRLCVMRLSNSFIKIKHVLHEIKDEMGRPLYKQHMFTEEEIFNSSIQKALGGFVFVLAEDGQCLYISSNVSEFLGLQQLDLTGHSIYKYIHPCDQDNLAKQLGGHVPLADMEIFDGLFCSDVHSPPPMQVKVDFGKIPHRSFCLRMKSTLTSRGKSVNMNASIHRVVHCTGTMKMCRMKRGISSGAITRCFLGVGIPLLCNTTFEVPLDQKTFISKHSLDFTLIFVDDIASDILGYSTISLKNKSWYMLCNVCDLGVLETCHKTVLQLGQSVSGYYRIMVKNGGWVWLQTKASMVYNSTTHMPAYIVCVQYVISGIELKGQVLSLSQIPEIAKRKAPEVKRRKMVKARDHHIASILPRNGMVKSETKPKSPVYEYTFNQNSRVILPAPCIPFPLHDVEINLCSLEDPSPPPILSGNIRFNTTSSTTIGEMSTDISSGLHVMEVKKSLKEVSLSDSIVSSKVVCKTDVASPADVNYMLTFDDNSSLSNLCDSYEDLEFGECSPVICEGDMEGATDHFGELQELSNANVSSLFLLQEEVFEGEKEDLYGMLFNESNDDSEEDNEDTKK